MFALLLRQLLPLAAALVLLVSLNKDQVSEVGWRLDWVELIVFVCICCDSDLGYGVCNVCNINRYFGSHDM